MPGLWRQKWPLVDFGAVREETIVDFSRVKTKKTVAARVETSLMQPVTLSF